MPDSIMMLSEDFWWEWGHGRVKWPNEMQFPSTHILRRFVFLGITHVTWHRLIAGSLASHKSLTLRCINMFMRQSRKNSGKKSNGAC